MRQLTQHTISTLLLILLASTALFAQEKGYVSVSGGFNNPIGDFKSTDVTYRPSGFAKPGGYFDISGGLKLSRLLGVAGLVRLQSNPISTTEIENKMNDQIQFQINFGSLPPGTHVAVSAESWKTNLFMAGFYFDAHFGSRVHVTPRVLIGYMHITSPDMSFMVTAPSYANEYSSRPGSTDGAFAFTIGLGARVDITKQIGIFLNGDYTTAATTVAPSEYTAPISMFTLGGGVGYLF